MGKYGLIVFFILIVHVHLHAQIDDNLDELKLAYLNVQNENYADAYHYFKQILRIYPKDPVYNYYAGRCLLFLDKSPSVAIKYLRFASTKEVPDDVYFYLGLAYLRNYEFKKALDSFNWFEKRASKKQLKEFEIQNYLSMAQNGQYLIKYIKKPLVYSKQKYTIDNFYKNYVFNDLDGYFTDRYDYFHLQKDSTSEPSIMYIPNNLGNNDVLYFSDINKKRGDYDIYRIVRLSDSTWSEPENLGDVINTPFDEKYPYLHSDGKTLYFASKGHYSMGGYDLYRSTWNWDTQEWTEPENLDFPINSPYNDILFVSSPNKKEAYFASDRETSGKDVMAYKLKVNDSEPYIQPKNHEEILKYSKLNVNITNEETERNKESEAKYKPDKEDIVRIKNSESFLHKTEYDSLLNAAINYQLKADSLRWAIDEKRGLFDNTENGQGRAKLSNEIIELEQEVYSLQKKADGCYERVRGIEEVNMASQKVIYEDVQKINETTSHISEEESNKSQNIYVEPEQDSLVKSKLTVVQDTLEETSEGFETGLRIETPSIYDASNPIPINEVLPKGIVYMIQLGAFSSEKSPVVFNGLTPLSCIKNENSSIRKYFAGKFYQLADAEKNLPIAKSNGFKDAYIVAFNSGNLISVKNAVKLESKENNLPKKELNNKQEVKSKTKKDLSIIFVLKGRIDLKDSLIVEQIKPEISDELELFIDDKKDSKDFLIKSFKTYDDAFAVKKKLEPLVKKEIEIHAYFAENQIPLEQARKITK